MLCPVCKIDLLSTKLFEDLSVELDICPSCHGAWFDAGELTRLDGSVWSNMERHPYHDVEGDHPEAVCPKCKESMYDQTRMDFPLEALSPPDAPDLIIDRCPSCFGFWLDGGELDRIVEIADTYDSLKSAERELDQKAPLDVGKSTGRKSKTLNERPPDWSWLKWVTYRFKRHLAEHADDML